MSCLGVMFAIDEKMKEKLLSMKRTEIVDYVKDELEGNFFEEKRTHLAEFDKSWDATQRAFSNGKLRFEKDGEYPLNHFICGERVLYGDGENEEDYIITLNSPAVVKDIYSALKLLDESTFRAKYDLIDEVEYGFPKSEEDFHYSWSWLQTSIEFWKTASEQNLYVLFTVDQ